MTSRLNDEDIAALVDHATIRFTKLTAIPASNDQLYALASIAASDLVIVELLTRILENLPKEGKQKP